MSQQWLRASFAGVGAVGGIDAKTPAAFARHTSLLQHALHRTLAPNVAPNVAPDQHQAVWRASSPGL